MTVTVAIHARSFSAETSEGVLAAALKAGAAGVQASATIARGWPSGAAVPLVAVSGTANLAHPDAGERARSVATLRAAVEVAVSVGSPVVSVCAGTRDALDPWRSHPDNRSAEAWADTCASLAAVLPLAESRGVTLAVEPEAGVTVCDAVQARRLLDELASPRLGVLLDAANLVGGRVSEQTAILAHAFALLADDVVLAHAKDLERVDHRAFVQLLLLLGRDVPLVLHDVEESRAATTIAALHELVAGR